MQLNKRPDNKTNQVQAKGNVPLDRSKYVIDDNATIPHGRHKDRTLEWVRNNDPQYVEWIDRENLYLAWGLVKEKNTTPTTINKPQYFVGSDNQVWLGLREVPGKSKESQYL